MEDKEKLEKFIAENPDLERLEEILRKFNIFEVLGIVEKELRHSNFLAWLLDPRSNHGQGDYFLKKFLLRICENGKELGIKTLPVVDVDSWNLSSTIVDREWQHIDILIHNREEGKNFVVAIENKVFSQEGESQLSEYREVVESEFKGFKQQFVFLTPEGDRPKKEVEADFWILLSYVDICEVIEYVLRAQTFMNENIKSFIEQYVQMLRRHILRESEAQELARKIFEAHEDAINFIIEHRPDRQKQIENLLQDMITENPECELDHSTKSYIRFISKSMDFDSLRKGTGGWTPSKRILLFEFRNDPDSVALHLVIGPSSDENIREKLINIAKSDTTTFNTADRKPSPKWFSVYKKQFLTKNDFVDFDLESIQENIEEKFESFVSEDLPKFEKIFRNTHLKELGT